MTPFDYRPAAPDAARGRVLGTNPVITSREVNGRRLAGSEGMPDAHYTDPRLVTLYDRENTWGADDDRFRELVGARGPCRVVDLGCGTGRLTLALAADGHGVTGVDPAAASLDAARGKPGADQVTWVHGEAADLATDSADVVLMSSHVAQVFTDDDEWMQTLGHLARALVPGGRLFFDSRDPDARAWERWGSTGRPALLETAQGPVRTWTEVDDVVGSRVSFTAHSVFPDGSRSLSRSTLVFRSEAELRADLVRAGLVVDAVDGDRRGEPVGASAGELVVQAHR